MYPGSFNEHDIPQACFRYWISLSTWYASGRSVSKNASAIFDDAAADTISHGITGTGADAVLAVNGLTDNGGYRTVIEGKRHITVLNGGM